MNISSETIAAVSAALRDNTTYVCDGEEFNNRDVIDALRMLEREVGGVPIRYPLREALDITTRQLRLYAGKRDTATLAILAANEALLTNSAPSAKTSP